MSEKKDYLLTYDEIDLRRAEEAKRRAETRLTNKDCDIQRAEIALKKAITRIGVKNK